MANYHNEWNEKCRVAAVENETRYAERSLAGKAKHAARTAVLYERYKEDLRKREEERADTEEFNRSNPPLISINDKPCTSVSNKQNGSIIDSIALANNVAQKSREFYASEDHKAVDMARHNVTLCNTAVSGKNLFPVEKEYTTNLSNVNYLASGNSTFSFPDPCHAPKPSGGIRSSLTQVRPQLIEPFNPQLQFLTNPTLPSAYDASAYMPGMNPLAYNAAFAQTALGYGNQLANSQAHVLSMLPSIPFPNGINPVFVPHQLSNANPPHNTPNS